MASNHHEMTPRDEAQALIDVLAVLRDKGAEFVRVYGSASNEVAPYQSEVLTAVQDMRRMVERDLARLEVVRDTYCATCRRFEHA